MWKEAALHKAADSISPERSLMLSVMFEAQPIRVDDLNSHTKRRTSWLHGRRLRGVMVFASGRIKGNTLVAFPQRRRGH